MALVLKPLNRHISGAVQHTFMKFCIMMPIEPLNPTGQNKMLFA